MRILLAMCPVELADFLRACTPSPYLLLNFLLPQWRCVDTACLESDHGPAISCAVQSRPRTLFLEMVHRGLVSAYRLAGCQTQKHRICVLCIFVFSASSRSPNMLTGTRDRSPVALQSQTPAGETHLVADANATCHVHMSDSPL